MNSVEVEQVEFTGRRLNMLYHVKSYDNRTGIAFGVLAAEYDPKRHYASGHMDTLYCPQTIDVESPFPYSFKPKHRFVGGILTIGELDDNTARPS